MVTQRCGQNVYGTGKMQYLCKSLQWAWPLMIFYTHVEHNPIKTIYVKYYMEKQTHTLHTHKPRWIQMCMTLICIIHHARMHTHTDCSRNWVMIQAGVKILREEEGFQFGFKRWQGWAVSKVLWEWIPNVGSKARKGAEAMSLAFALLGFQYAEEERSVWDGV